MKLSVLDQVPVARGNSLETTFDQTLELIALADRLGYERYWFAEHHNTRGLLSNSPELWMTRALSMTSQIRVGSGGILLPQYSPYKVAETAKTIELMFPGRVDIGLGNSPGGAEITRKALSDGRASELKEFTRKLQEVKGFIHNSLAMDHPFRTVKAGPRIDHFPQLFSLGLTVNGAKRAAELGIGYVFGHFLNPKYGIESIREYRKTFIPSEVRYQPYVIMCVFVVCHEESEMAEKHATTQDHWLLNISKGGDTTIPSINEVQKRSYSEEDKKLINENRKRCVIGNPQSVKEQLTNLQQKFDADELMIITNIHSHEARLNSYKLVRQLFE